MKGVHVAELRTALDAARTSLGLTAGGYTDASLANVKVKAIHSEELRDRVE